MSSFNDTIPWPILRRDEGHTSTGSLQHLLAHHGLQVAVDQTFGPKTEAAVRTFQSQRNLVVDGIVGPKPWTALIVTVRTNSKGDAVRAVQHQSFVREGSGSPTPGLAIDGDFGPKTEVFVRDFQQALHNDFQDDNIAVDGIVGPVTWRGLIGGFLTF